MVQRAGGSLEERQARLWLLSATPASRSVIGHIARQLRLGPDAVHDLLARTPCPLPLSDQLPDLTQIRSMLLAVGLRVELVDGGDVPLCLTLLPEPAADKENVSNSVARVLSRDPAEVRRSLFRPLGMTLGIDRRRDGDGLTRRLRRIRSLMVVESHPDTATYDVFATANLPGLTAHLRFLGYLDDPLTGAIAAGLDHRAAQHILRLFPAAVVLDRAVQRFDLSLLRPVDWTSDDVAEFLMARTGLPRSRFDTVTPERPIRLESALSRPCALRFRTDYAAMGLQTALSPVLALQGDPQGDPQGEND